MWQDFASQFSSHMEYLVFSHFHYIFPLPIPYFNIVRLTSVLKGKKKNYLCKKPGFSLNMHQAGGETYPVSVTFGSEHGIMHF